MGTLGDFLNHMQKVAIKKAAKGKYPKLVTSVHSSNVDQNTFRENGFQLSSTKDTFVAGTFMS